MFVGYLFTGQASQRSNIPEEGRARSVNVVYTRLLLNWRIKQELLYTAWNALVCCFCSFFWLGKEGWTLNKFLWKRWSGLEKVLQPGSRLLAAATHKWPLRRSQNPPPTKNTLKIRHFKRLPENSGCEWRWNFAQAHCAWIILRELVLKKKVQVCCNGLDISGKATSDGKVKKKKWECDECKFVSDRPKKLIYHKKIKHQGGYKDTDEGEVKQ